MLIGRRISGRYKIIRMIGGGGMANVYLAHDMILDRDVAIKILRLDFANEEEFIRRFQREAQSATSLTHENIVSIYDIGEEKEIYYIVMEYVDGMTLKQYIQYYYPLTVEQTLNIMKQLTSAVAHAHENHIIHRDIKPQNILIDQQGHVMITDFGIAMALSATSITQTNAVLGSVHYLSPEQARGGMATKKSDLYSLGIVMFELLTGRLPFSGESAISIALKHLQSDTPLPTRWNPNIPQSVENIVLKATAKDPFIRYDSAEEMEQDIVTALDPARINEPRFEIPEDHDATKAIPIISDMQNQNVNEDTIHHQKTTPNKTKITKKEKKEKKEKNKKKKWPWIVGGISSLLILFILFFVFLLPLIFEAQNIIVPDVRNEEYDDAVVKLVDEGLEIGERVNTSNEEVPEGHVIRTSPKEGSEVKKGQKIKLYISTGKETYVISNYIGKQYDDVEKLLRDKGFEIEKEEVYDEQAEGIVISQSHQPNEELIPDETTLVLTVSKGKEKISLRDLREYNLKGLESYEESSGLKIEIASEEFSDEVPEGLVISQNPEPNTSLEKGDTVSVVISKGREVIPPKTVVKEITIPYEPAEEGEEQEIKILIDDKDHTMTVPADSFTITQTTTKEYEFVIEQGNTAGYKVMRDNTVIEEGEVEYPED